MNTLVKCVLCLSLGLSACAAPRTNTHSGKVTPKGHVKVGFDMAPNLPVNTIEVAGATAVSEFNSVTGMQENTLEEDALYDYSKLLVAQAVDPLASGLTLYGRYGVAEHLDLGFGYSSGTLVYDVAYQFMGSSEPIGSR